MTNKKPRINRSKKDKKKLVVRKYRKESKGRFTPFYDIKYIIKNYELKSDMKISISIIASIILLLVIGFSIYNSLYGSAVNQLVKHVENRNLPQASHAYEEIMENKGNYKKTRINNNLSQKLTKIFLNSGDDYIYKNLSKESFIGTVNIINALSDVKINKEKVTAQAKSIYEAYVDGKISYDRASNYLNISSTLNGIGSKLNGISLNLDEISESRDLFIQAEKLKNNRNYYKALKSYERVLKEDRLDYDKAQMSIKEIIQILPEHYIEQAKAFEKEGNIESALECCSYILEYDPRNQEAYKLKKRLITKIDDYELTEDDIISIYRRKTNNWKSKLRCEKSPVIVDKVNLMSATIYEEEKLIDRFLISNKGEKIYTLRNQSEVKNNDFSDGYYMTDEDGVILISKEKTEINKDIKNYINKEKLNSEEISELSFDDLKDKLTKEKNNLLVKEGKVNNYYKVKGNNKSKILVYNIYSGKIMELK